MRESQCVACSVILGNSVDLPLRVTPSFQVWKHSHLGFISYLPTPSLQSDFESTLLHFSHSTHSSPYLCYQLRSISHQPRVVSGEANGTALTRSEWYTAQILQPSQTTLLPVHVGSGTRAHSVLVHRYIMDPLEQEWPTCVRGGGLN